MELTIPRADLARELGLARRLGERKATVPIYGFARLLADGDAIVIESTDGESALRVRCPAMALEDGQMLVPVRALHEIAKAAVAETVVLTADKLKVKVKAGSFSSTLQVLDLQDFPVPPTMPADGLQLPAALLRTALEKTKFVADAAGANSQNYFLKGVYLDFQPGKFTLAATDGYRLALVESECPAITSAVTAIIPKRTVDDLLALMASEGSPDTVTYVTDESRAYFQAGDRLLVSRLVDGTYPNYRKIIPAQSTTALTVERVQWLGALRRVLLLAGETSRRVRVDIADAAMTLSLARDSVGDASEPVPVVLEAGGWTAAFEGQYLADYLAAADQDTVAFQQKAPNQGGLLRTSGEDGVTYSYVIMPMALA